MYDINDLNSSVEKNIPYKNLLYKFWFSIKRLFCNPYKIQQHDLNFLGQVEVLINSSEDIKDVLEPSEKLIALHRILENTKARRRLERWITRVISFYLIIVLIILIISSSFLKLKIQDDVIIVLLSTTTVNIVALGLILVRGLFHENEYKDIKTENPMMKKEK